MNVFGYLLLAHLLYDLHWQGQFISEHKGNNMFLLGVHALTWGLLLVAVLCAFHAEEWWQLIFLGTTHYFIDYWKTHQRKFNPLRNGLWIDQAAHLVTILIVAFVR